MSEGVETTHGDILQEVKSVNAQVSQLQGILAVLAIVVGCTAMTISLIYMLHKMED